jgi:uncharacterized protein (TIGR02266 family)
MNEKRKHSRIRKSLKCEVQSDGLTFSSTIDISSGGMFISTPEPLNSESGIDLLIFLPGEEPLPMKAWVKWSRDEDDSNKAGMGVEFINPSEDSLRLINRFIGE